jgi:2-oxoglutarate ferredoxin oxidoreductase subunit delta
MENCLMATRILPELRINRDRCKGCAYCVAFCPKEVLRMSEDLNSRGVHSLEVAFPEKCTGCGICATMCPDLCIEVYK